MVKTLPEMMESIAALEQPAPLRLRLSGMDCPVERMLLGATLQRDFPAYTVVSHAAYPVVHMLPKPEPDAETGEVPEIAPEPPAFLEHTVEFPQQTPTAKDLPFFAGVVALAVILQFLPTTALQYPFGFVPLIVALAVYTRFIPKNFRWHLKGLAYGWPTPRLLLWLAASLPIVALFFAGFGNPRLLDGAILLFVAHALWQWQTTRLIGIFPPEEADYRAESIPPIAHFVAQFSLWAAMLVAAFAFTLWFYPPSALAIGGILGGLDFLRLGNEYPVAASLNSAMAVLLLPPASAILLAGPLLHAVCLKRLQNRGILCVSSGVLARLENVRVLAMGKTGILTQARPKVTETVACEGYNGEYVLGLAAALGAEGTHPHTAAVGAHAQRKRLEVPTAEEIAEWPGLGVSGLVGGRRYYLGSGRFMAALALDTEGIHHAQYRLGRSGESVLAVADNTRALGVVALRDPLRPGCVKANKTLASLGVTPVLLSRGDAGLAETVAEQAGAVQWFAENTGEDLAAALRRFAKEKLGGCALLCLNEPGAKLRTVAEVVIGQNTSGAAIDGVHADMEVPRGVEDIAEIMELLQDARQRRHQVLFAAVLCMFAAFTAAVFGLLPAIFAPFIPVVLMNYAHWHASRLHNGRTSEAGAEKTQ